VADSNESQSHDPPIQLKDPLVAGVLAWLIPGLGHFYQGRNAKGALFMICIMGTFLYGLYLGGSKEVGWGRAVYFSFRTNDWRLPWLCQIGVGFPTVPMTLLQSRLKDKPLFNGFMAPPPLPEPDGHDNGPPAEPPPPAKMNLGWINRLLPRYFEMGTVYTMIAGLLNILAVYDACCGPVPAESAKKEGEKPQGKRDGADGAGADGAATDRDGAGRDAGKGEEK
jgi:hypothetical protein